MGDIINYDAWKLSHGTDDSEERVVSSCGYCGADIRACDEVVQNADGEVYCDEGCLLNSLDYTFIGGWELNDL